MVKNENQIIEAFKQLAHAFQPQLESKDKSYCEMIATSFAFDGITRGEFMNACPQDYTWACDIIDSMHDGIETDDGLYKSKEYFDIFKQVKDFCKKIENGDQQEVYTELVTSRRLVHLFKPEHCFTSIQFLVRPRIEDPFIDEVIVIANMRSCNCADNLFTDWLICYTLGEMVRCAFMCAFPDFLIAEGIDLVMNVGSLHIFKDKKGKRNVV